MSDALDTEVTTVEEPEGRPEPDPVDQVRPSSPTRAGRVTKVVRFLRHEWTLASLAGVVIAVVYTWPTVAHPFTTLPGDLGDPTLQAWQVAWTGHALLHDPLNLWNTNTFYPEKLTLAYSDTLLGYAPAGFFGSGVKAALFRYNMLYVFAFALASIGAYALARQLGAGRLGGVVAGLAFAYAPWRVSHNGHLNILSTGGIALALAMLARGHDWSLFRADAQTRERRFRPGWVIAGWLTATWQVSLGFGLGIPFGWFLVGICLVSAAGFGVSWLVHHRRPPFPRRVLAMDVLGGLIFGGVALLMSLPYVGVTERVPSGERTEWDIEAFSVPWRGLFVASRDNWLWGDKHAALREQVGDVEGALLPGFFLIALAIAGTYYSVWRPYQRALLAMGVGVVSALAMGTYFGDGDPGYLTLFRHLPGWNAMRTPGRLVVWSTLFLGLLAAGFLTALTRLAHRLRTENTDGAGRARRIALSGALSLLAVGLLVPVAVEGIDKTENPELWRVPAAMHGIEGPVLVIPAEGWLQGHVMLWSTDGFPQVANGTSGVIPESLDETSEETKFFPDADSVEYLRSIGIKTVLWDADFGPDSDWSEAPNLPLDGLGVTKEKVGDDWVFHLG